jgi:hypothetical protein
MKDDRSFSDQKPMHPALAFQRISLAACILLMPLSITLYLLSWEGNQRAPLTPLITSAMAGATGNTLHFIGAIAASFFLPLGYLGMSLLGMRRAPWLATLSAISSASSGSLAPSLLRWPCSKTKIWHNRRHHLGKASTHTTRNGIALAA